jgi:DNA-binding MarR family transcriptional regulator
MSLILSMIPVMHAGSPPAGEVFAHSAGANYVHVWREVILTYRRLMRSVAANTPYTGAQFEVLRQLAVADGRSTVSELARELAVDPAAVTRLVADLTRLGLVARERDARDGRRRPVILTEDGRRQMTALHDAMHACELGTTAGIDEQAVETAIGVLQALRAAVDSLPDRRG